MTLYPIALFLHVVGALGLFMALGLEWTSLLYLRRAATAEQVREWVAIVARLRWVYAPSFVALLLTGFYMTAVAWTEAGWVGVALAALLLIASLGMVLTGRRMAPIVRAAAVEHGSLSPDLRHRLHDPLLWTSVQTRLAVALGIVFLMTVKPDLGGALLTTGAALLLGLVSTVPAWGRDRTKAAAA